ncbi:MAG: hypothetical protein HFH31_04740, partial [Bacilli bacterium]|nr:hypothetical protein [Bacilli bacterium]
IGDNGFVYLLSKIIEFIINTCYYLLFIIIYIYIFQIVYLNNEKYKNRVVEKKEEIIEEENSLEVNENISDHEIKVKKRERHEKVLGAGDAIFRFLGSIIMFLSKCFVCFCTIPILMILFFLCAGLLITFYLLCKGVFYISILIGIPFAIVFTILILEILFYFILGKKRNDKRIIITFLVSFIGLGLSFGMLVLDIGSIDYIDDIPKNAEVSTINRIYTMTEDLYFPFFYDIEYISDNKLENEVKVEIEYYEDYVKVYFPSDLQSGYNNYYIADNISIKNIITQMITDLKDRTFYNYGKLNEVKIKVYANDNNITILKDNYQKLYEEWEENHYQEGIDDYERRITDLEEEKSNLENEKFELESKIEELENENIEYQNKIEDYKSRLQSIIEE